MTDDWELVAVQGLGVTFRYPATAPSGARVDLDEVRVHLRSRDSDEVYAEVSRHLQLSAAELYEREREFVVERLGATVEPLAATELGGRAAQRFSFAWGEKRREVVLVEHGEWLYRIVYDPASPLNHELLGTIRWS